MLVVESLGMRTKSIKIAVVYHRESQIVRDDVYAPILAGAAVTTQPCKDGQVRLGREFLKQIPLRDDDGENVSGQNRAINEMSVVYWMWKNYAKLGNPENVGLAHYRRFFITDETPPLPKDRWFPGSEMYLYQDAEAFRRAIDSSKLVEILQTADVLCSHRYAASNIKRRRPIRSCRDRYVDLLGEEKGALYDEMERLVLAARPNFAVEIDYMRTHADHYVCNMFVMPREQFFAYCEFVFPILFKLVELNSSARDAAAARAPGFLAEFLTSIFLSGLVREGSLRVKCLPIACWGILPHGRLWGLARDLLPDTLRLWLKRKLKV